MTSPLAPPATGCVPDFIIIGAMKAGTTSLHYYLSCHPQIAMSQPKELDFFCDEQRWARGKDWYLGHFAATGKKQGEASPNYTDFPQVRGVPERMYSVAPEARLIYVLRDPIDRILSHYVHYCSTGEENRSLEEALSEPRSSPYVLRSRYHWQLQPFLGFYPLEQFLFVTQESLLRHRTTTIQQAFRFLEVDAEFDSVRFRGTRHRSRDRRRKTPLGRRIESSFVQKWIGLLPGDLRWHVERLLYLPFSRAIPRPQLSPALRGTLSEILAEDVAQLRAATGLALADWSL